MHFLKWNYQKQCWNSELYNHCHKPLKIKQILWKNVAEVLIECTCKSFIKSVIPDVNHFEGALRKNTTSLEEFGKNISLILLAV